MQDLKIKKAEEKDRPYIEEKLKNYLLDSANVSWEQFFVVRNNDKTVAFGRVIDHKDYFEIASLGVDYYYRGKGIGVKLLRFLTEEARRKDARKPIYGVTHRPGFFKKVDFKEVDKFPEALEYKRTHKCRLHPSKIKIVKMTD